MAPRKTFLTNKEPDIHVFATEDSRRPIAVYRRLNSFSMALCGVSFAGDVNPGDRRQDPYYSGPRPSRDGPLGPPLWGFRARRPPFPVLQDRLGRGARSSGDAPWSSRPRQFL